MAQRKSQPKKRRTIQHAHNITVRGVLKPKPNYSKLARAVLEIAKEERKIEVDMTTLHEGDERAKCEGCGKAFVLHSHTTGEDRRFCFTCRTLRKACPDCEALTQQLIARQSSGPVGLNELFCSRHNPLAKQ